MVVDDREAWKARQEDYRAQRRKRSRKTRAKAEAKYFWDSAHPPLRWDDVTPRWQSAISRFLLGVREGRPCEEAWDRVAPSSESRWGRDLLGDEWRRALKEVADAAG